MPIATSLCPDEVDHHDNDAEDDADADDEELKRWSSLVRQQQYLPVHFPQKQDINQLKWQAVKLVEIGGTRNNEEKLMCASFENHSASHFPPGPPHLLN